MFNIGDKFKDSEGNEYVITFKDSVDVEYRSLSTGKVLIRRIETMFYYFNTGKIVKL